MKVLGQEREIQKKGPTKVKYHPSIHGGRMAGVRVCPKEVEHQPGGVGTCEGQYYLIGRTDEGRNRERKSAEFLNNDTCKRKRLASIIQLHCAIMQKKRR